MVVINKTDNRRQIFGVVARCGTTLNGRKMNRWINVDKYK